MTSEAHPRPPAFWADVRFLLGIVLVIGSIASVWFVVVTARQTAPVLAASRTLVPGETLTADDLQTVEVGLGSAEDSYLVPGALPEGAVVTRTVERGELLAHSAVGTASGSLVTTVVLRTTTDVPSSVGTGSAVEVWAAEVIERGRFDLPQVLVPRATVVSVTRGDSVMGGGETSLELVIARSDLAVTLAAVAGGAALSVVPAVGEQR